MRARVRFPAEMRQSIETLQLYEKSAKFQECDSSKSIKTILALPLPGFGPRICYVCIEIEGKLRPRYEGAGSIPGGDATILIDLNFATLRKIG